jgi:hypothetical protein
MKSNTLIPTVLIAAGILFASAGVANAQLANPIEFTTTFPFTVSGKTMPAGRYTASPLPMDPAILQISNGRSAVMLLTENDVPTVHPRRDEVTFVKRGDSYVLSEIWDSASGTGVEAVPQHAKTRSKGK